MRLPRARRPQNRKVVAYDESYFQAGGGRQAGVTGYGTYDRRTSNADLAAYLLWRFMPFTTSLDVGCAQGFLVEALCELGYDARGWDVSHFATSQGEPWVRDRLRVVDLESRLARLRRGRDRYSLITLLEVMEHIDPANVPQVLRFIRRIATGYVVATIPSIGVNDNGPSGFPDGKVRDEVLGEYKAKNDSYDGPVPAADLMLDAAGKPIEGHVCIASYRWWTRQFEAAGFTRVADVEHALNPVVGRFNDLAAQWNLYVFAVPGAPPAPIERSDLEIAAIERRWDLFGRPVGQNSLNITKDTVGEDAVQAIWREFDDSQRRQQLFLDAV